MDFKTLNKKLSSPQSYLVLFAILLIALALAIPNLPFSAITQSLSGPFGYVVLFFAVLALSMVLFLPVPVVAVVLAASNTLDPLLVGVVSGIASGIGELSGYFIGAGSERLIDAEGKEGGKYKRAKEVFKKYGFWGIVAAAAFPITPIDFVGLIAGALRYGWKKFLLAAVIGKIPRYLMVAYFGKAMMGWIS